MAGRLEYILVVDLEATCWEEGPIPHPDSEIIEFGLALYSVQERKIESAESYYVQPVSSEISEYCRQLTGITPFLLKSKGVPLVEACDKIREKYQLDSNQLTWASWGDFDRTFLHHQCEKLGVEFPFSQTHLNLKNLFAIKMQLEYEVSLKKAFSMLPMIQEGRAHSGMDDAINTARVLEYVLK
jgi:inhibitor of KinA sporulation pathway (predicted exonuclease)